jgi:hypothetical protein
VKSMVMRMHVCERDDGASTDWLIELQQRIFETIDAQGSGSTATEPEFDSIFLTRNAHAIYQEAISQHLKAEAQAEQVVGSVVYGMSHMIVRTCLVSNAQAMRAADTTPHTLLARANEHVLELYVEIKSYLIGGWCEWLVPC